MPPTPPPAHLPAHPKGQVSCTTLKLRLPRSTSWGHCDSSRGQSWDQLRSVQSRSSLPALKAERRPKGLMPLLALSWALLAWLQAVGGEGWVSAPIAACKRPAEQLGHASCLTACADAHLPGPGKPSTAAPDIGRGAGWAIGSSGYEAASPFCVSALARSKKKMDARVKEEERHAPGEGWEGSTLAVPPCFKAAHQGGPVAFSKSSAHCSSASPQPHGLGLSESRRRFWETWLVFYVIFTDIHCCRRDPVTPHPSPLLAPQPLTEGSARCIVFLLDFRGQYSPFYKLYKKRSTCPAHPTGTNINGICIVYYF